MLCSSFNSAPIYSLVLSLSFRDIVKFQIINQNVVKCICVRIYINVEYVCMHTWVIYIQVQTTKEAVEFVSSCFILLFFICLRTNQSNLVELSAYLTQRKALHKKSEEMSLQESESKSESVAVAVTERTGMGSNLPSDSALASPNSGSSSVSSPLSLPCLKPPNGLNPAQSAECTESSRSSRPSLPPAPQPLPNLQRGFSDASASLSEAGSTCTSPRTPRAKEREVDLRLLRFVQLFQGLEELVDGCLHDAEKALSKRSYLIEFCEKGLIHFAVKSADRLYADLQAAQKLVPHVLMAARLVEPRK